jgi:predicted alpha/beta-hydrolase family hydrolase
MKKLDVHLEHHIAFPSQPNQKGVVVLSHGGNNGFDSSLITLLKDEFTKKGYISIPYNFAYLSKHEGPSQGLKNELHDLTQIVKGVATLFPGLPLHLIGKSLGGIVSSWYARDYTSRVASVGILGYIPDKENIDFGNYNGTVNIVQGSNDKYGTIDGVRRDLERFHVPFYIEEILDSDHSYRSVTLGENHEREAVEALLRRY